MCKAGDMCCDDNALYLLAAFGEEQTFRRRTRRLVSPPKVGGSGLLGTAVAFHTGRIVATLSRVESTAPRSVRRLSIDQQADEPAAAAVDAIYAHLAPWDC